MKMDNHLRVNKHTAEFPSQKCQLTLKMASTAPPDPLLTECGM